MNEQKKVSLPEFEKAIESGELKTSQIIQFALGIGVFIFGVITLVLYNYGEIETASIDEEIVQILTIINFVLMIFSYWISKNIYESYFTHNFMSKFTLTRTFANYKDETSESAANLIAKIRTAEIIRSAMREGPALFGLVICVLAISNNVLQVNSEYWINCIPAILFIGHIYINFPTKDKYISLYQNKILNY